MPCKEHLETEYLLGFAPLCWADLGGFGWGHSGGLVTNPLNLKTIHYDMLTWPQNDGNPVSEELKFKTFSWENVTRHP